MLGGQIALPAPRRRGSGLGRYSVAACLREWWTTTADRACRICLYWKRES